MATFGANNTIHISGRSLWYQVCQQRTIRSLTHKKGEFIDATLWIYFQQSKEARNQDASYPHLPLKYGVQEQYAEYDTSPFLEKDVQQEI